MVVLVVHMRVCMRVRLWVLTRLRCHNERNDVRMVVSLCVYACERVRACVRDSLDTVCLLLIYPSPQKSVKSWVLPKKTDSNKRASKGTMADKVGAVKRGGDAMARGVGSVFPGTHCMDCCRCPALIRLAIACHASVQCVTASLSCRGSCALSLHAVLRTQAKCLKAHIASPLPSGGWEGLL